MNIGQTLKKLRKEKKITQSELAKECGLAKSYISMIENGQNIPSIPVLEKMCNYLNIPLPLFTLLAYEDADIPEEKREFLNKVQPLMKALLEKTYE